MCVLNDLSLQVALRSVGFGLLLGSHTMAQDSLSKAFPKSLFQRPQNKEYTLKGAACLWPLGIRGFQKHFLAVPLAFNPQLVLPNAFPRLVARCCFMNPPEFRPNLKCRHASTTGSRRLRLGPPTLDLKPSDMGVSKTLAGPFRSPSYKDYNHNRFGSIRGPPSSGDSQAVRQIVPKTVQEGSLGA